MSIAIPPQQHIDRIREVKFGLKPDGSYEYNALADDLHRAILNLSEGLYSKDVHFILELIQNAEDNQYYGGVTPALAFRLLSEDPTASTGSDGALVVINNETGFQPCHVAALCAIGQSTKDKRQGYIGEKGIGFKSVFVVSAHPHIFSGGYQFRFQDEPDAQVPLGYVVPYWVPGIPSALSDYVDQTCIVLPLRADKRREIAAQLAAIAPETILFLSKLDKLDIHIEGEPSIRVTVERQVIDDHLVQLTAGYRRARFWVTHREVPVPPDMSDEKRQGITTRTVSVALPLSGEGVSPSRVFAFLPTEVNSGLPFFVNADFIVSTSRESILYDRPWNAWLRDCISSVFVEAFQTLLGQPGYRYKAYSFVPLLEDVAHEFFRPVVESIHRELGSRPVVWAHGVGTPKIPDDTRLAHQNFRDLINSANGKPQPLRLTPLVRRHIEVYEQQLMTIGVRSLADGEILSCLADTEWMGCQETSWFLALYRYLTARAAWATPDRLKSLKLLPLDGGGLGNGFERPVYFSPPADLDIALLSGQTGNLLHFGFLHPQLASALTDDKDLKAWLASRQGVRELTLENACLDLAQALNERRANLDLSVLIQLTRYIRDHSSHLDEGGWRALRQALPLLLDANRVAPPPDWSDEDPLVVPAALNPEDGWSIVFADPVDRLHSRVLSDAYVAGAAPDDRKVWHTFFRRLGATESPPPRKKKWRWSWPWSLPDDIPEQTRLTLQSLSEYSTAGHRLTDHIAPEWLHQPNLTATAGALADNRARALLRWLDQRSDSLHRSRHAEYEWHYYRWRWKSFPSDLVACLHGKPWLPTTQGLKCPREVFLDRPEIREILGDSVPYALENVPDDVAELLEMHSTATRDEVMRYLAQYASRPPEKADPATVQKIYAFLAERWQSDLRDQFESGRLILGLRPAPRWLSTVECIWPDLSEVFGSAYAYLESEYPPRLKQFFVDQLGIPETTDPEHYANAWRRLADGSADTPEHVEAALSIMFPKLQEIAEHSWWRYNWWQDFCRAPKVWTHRHRFESANLVFLPDDRELVEQFGHQVGFAWIPAGATLSDYHALFTRLGVRSAAREAHMAPVESVEARDDGAQSVWLTSPAKRAVCLYLRNEAPQRYRDLKENGALESFLRTGEAPTSHLRVQYRLGSHQTTADSVAFWYREHHTLYWSAEHDPDEVEVEIASTLARQLMGEHPHAALENFVGRIMKSSDAKVSNIARKHNWTLPEEEESWIHNQLEPMAVAEVQNLPVAEVQIEHRGPSPDQSGTGALRQESGGVAVGGKPSFGPGTGGTGHAGRETGDRAAGGTGEREHIPGVGDYRPRLRSYVEPVEHPPQVRDENTADVAHRQQVEEAGIRAAVKYEESRGRTPRELDRTHAGWDINSFEKQPDHQEPGCGASAGAARRIEVKAIEGTWDGWGIGLTAREYDCARQYGDDYYLYVVEHALDAMQCQIHVFRNPTSKVIDYRLDDRWKQAADDCCDLK